MKPKKTNSITKQDLLAKSAFDEYLCTNTFRMQPVSDAFIDKLAQELVDWAKNDDEAYKLSQFYLAKGIYDSDFYRWMDRSDNLSKAHKTALRFIGNRREIGALKRKLDAGVVNYTMAHYDPDWKSLAEWKARLADKDDAQGNIKVIIEQFPSSPLVPDKKGQDE